MSKTNINKNTLNKPKPNKLSESLFERPLLTYQDMLSRKDIEGQLLDYEKVSNLEDVPVGTHIRYFESKDGELKYRVGGILTIKTGLPAYIILSNGKVSWSVQVSPCIFFRRITIRETKLVYEKIIESKDYELDELRNYIKELKKEILQLKNTNSKKK
jgi:hypothetical protein